MVIDIECSHCAKLKKTYLFLTICPDHHIRETNICAMCFHKLVIQGWPKACSAVDHYINPFAPRVSCVHWALLDRNSNGEELDWHTSWGGELSWLAPR